ncbi:MAG: hypothetical protein LBF83_02325 [Spirochaetaceae bacterium]|jgi:hypothetical protein|nr:hypothetical protein [Spirochaetaceae bacterium]
MMTANEAAEAAKGLTFETVWAMFQETDRQIKEGAEEARRRQAELSEEADRRHTELSEKADRRHAELEQEFKEIGRYIKKLSKNIGGINNSFGKWAESIFSAKLWEKFRDLGYTFTKGGPQKFFDGDVQVAQVDMLLENGDYALLLEVKSELTAEDVDEHLERIEKIRRELDKRGDKRKLLGAVAGMVTPDNVREYARKKGLYVLVQSGKSIEVCKNPAGFSPRVW